MSPYDVVIFDLDGTLTKSEEGIVKSAAYALEKLGKPVANTESLLAFIGPPLVHSFEHLSGLNQEEVKEAVKYYRERYNTVGQYENAVYTGIRTLLYELKKQGKYLAIATGKPQEPTERILAYFGLTPFFHKVAGVTRDESRSTKEHLIKSVLPASYQNAVMVGDRLYDIEGAKANKIDSIGVIYGYGSKEELAKAGADKIVNSVEELTEVLLPGGISPSAGCFLSVEGGDGSGKSTQVQLLEKNLQKWGFDIVSTREPGGTRIGEKIREVVLDIENIGMTPQCEALLYAAARAQHVTQVIHPALQKGKVVLCDRFVDSSIAYQGGGRELGVSEVEAINKMAVAGTMPDMTVYLSIDYKESLARRKKATSLDRIEIEEEAFHHRVQQAYEQIIEKDPDRFLLIDGAPKAEEVEKEVMEKVLGKLMARERE
ncbi:MAG: dTMP kinase [Clostridiales bacterium]|nr:dTMP kinase [Clostridiales bacterium]